MTNLRRWRKRCPSPSGQRWSVCREQSSCILWRSHTHRFGMFWTWPQMMGGIRWNTLGGEQIPLILICLQKLVEYHTIPKCVYRRKLTIDDFHSEIASLVWCPTQSHIQWDSMRNILHQESIAMAPIPAGCFPHLSEGLVGKGWAALVERHLVWFVEEPSVASSSYCKAWGVWAFYCLEVVFQLKQMMVPIWKEDLLFHVYELQTTFVSKPN